MDSIISVLLTMTVLALVVVIMQLVQQRSTEDAALDTEEAVHKQLARAERRIERLMAEARGDMFDEVRDRLGRNEP